MEDRCGGGLGRRASRIRSRAPLPLFPARCQVTSGWASGRICVHSLEFRPVPAGRNSLLWDCKVTPARSACQGRNTIGCIPSNDGLGAGFGSCFPHGTSPVAKWQGFKVAKFQGSKVPRALLFSDKLPCECGRRSSAAEAGTFFYSQLPALKRCSPHVIVGHIRPMREDDGRTGCGDLRRARGIPEESAWRASVKCA